MGHRWTPETKAKASLKMKEEWKDGRKGERREEREEERKERRGLGEFPMQSNISIPEDFFSVVHVNFVLLVIRFKVSEGSY